MPRKAQDEMRSRRSGSILILAMWALLFLGVLAVAVSSSVSSHISTTLTLADRAAAYGAARAGVESAIAALRVESNGCFDLSQSWNNNPGLLRDIGVGDAVFSVFNVEDVSAGEVITNYGLLDEERKIDVNFVTNDAGRKVVESLIRTAGRVNGETAENVADCIADWVDGDDDPRAKGAENGHYTGLLPGYRCHNGPIDCLEELLLVKGVDTNLFLRIGKYLTVHSSAGKINLNTACSVVLRSMAAARKNDDPAICSSFADRILEFRKAGGVLRDTDKRSIKRDLYDFANQDRNQEAEWTIMEWLINHRLVTVQSRHFCGISSGYARSGGSRARRIAFVYDSERDEIGAWNED